MKKYFTIIRYILEYVIFISILKILKLLGINKSSAICSKIAVTIGPFLPITRIAKKNLRYVFGQDINDTVFIKDLWDNFGRFIGEFPYTNLSKQELDNRVEIIGMNHLVEFQKNNNPFLLCTGHFANWDLLLQCITKLYPKFGIVYRSANNHFVDRYINTHRTKNKAIHLIPKGDKGVRSLLASIKAGHSIAMLVDQKMNNGIEVPFFNKPAMTSYAIARLALQFDYPIVPVQMVRTKGCNFKIIIHSPLQIANTGNKQQDYYNVMLRINLILEQWIIENKSQWFWFHNRWK